MQKVWSSFTPSIDCATFASLFAIDGTWMQYSSGKAFSFSFLLLFPLPPPPKALEQPLYVRGRTNIGPACKRAAIGVARVLFLPAATVVTNNGAMAYVNAAIVNSNWPGTYVLHGRLFFLTAGYDNSYTVPMLAWEYQEFIFNSQFELQNFTVFAHVP